MEIRFLAGALLGSALTVGISSLAQAPKSHPIISECSVLHDDVVILEGDLRDVVAVQKQMERDLQGIGSSVDTEATWARSVNSQLSSLDSQFLNLELALRMR